MELRNQLIDDIRVLPDDAVKAISVVVKQFIVFSGKSESTPRPVRRPFQFGCMEGQIHIPDDFNEPLDDFKEYM